MGILDEIVAAKRAEVAPLVRRRAALHADAAAAPAPRDFAAALRRPGGALAVIAEIKRRSPSKGDLDPGLDPAALATRYEAGGAAALSVLTDSAYFGGSLADLIAARGASPLPALRKDFTIDPLQLYEGRAAGADAVLLIVAALSDDGLLRDLHETARGLGLAVLVEAHDEHELDRALAGGAQIVGVNSRSLHTFDEDRAIAIRLASHIPAAVVKVAESAIRTARDAQEMADAGFDAVLVGEAAVRAPDPSSFVAALAAVKLTERR
jgi:indole-3-glycerol phosphate synthase